MNSPDIRWMQRFENFDKAYALLKRTLTIEQPSEAERGGLIQFYEMAFELAWKLMKDYLTEQGYELASPRQAIKQAFQSGLIEDGHGWIDALADRNLTVHTYDEAKAIAVEKAIRQQYFPLLSALHHAFRQLHDQ